MEKKSIREIISVIFKAMTLAMGVAVVVLSCMEAWNRKPLTRCKKLVQKEQCKEEQRERKARILSF